VEHSDWPTEISAALIGSCTNSSYEDLARAASLAKQATDAGLFPKSQLLIGPGSEEIRATVARDGVLEELQHAGGKVLANACGACVGQWERPEMGKGEKNSSECWHLSETRVSLTSPQVLSSFNRNFSGRQDGNPATHSFVASPEVSPQCVVTCVAHRTSARYRHGFRR
jgi:aconitate hydratase